MNVYTHVSVKDLAKDVENLPAVGRAAAPVKPPASAEEPAAEAPGIPEDLAVLLSSWKSLPDNVRTAINTLARA